VAAGQRELSQVRRLAAFHQQDLEFIVADGEDY
jgi:hypothetical protein